MQVTKTIEICRPELFMDKDFLHQKYTVESLSTKQIAAITFSSKTTVLKYLKEFGISIRESGNNLRRKRGVAYGTFIKNAELKVFKREAENIEKMRQLRAKGFSFWQIADALNSWKIPTKTRKDSWHAKTIMSILSRKGFPRKY